MSNPPKRRGLGRGLSALLPNTPDAAAKPGAEETSRGAASAGKRAYFQAQIEEIYPNPDQPRKRFEEAALEELAQSIRALGVIQPLIVRARPEGGYYLVAGERRWRASQRAGLHQVPVVVRELAPRDAFERALVENLQRADLNAIEEAEAYQRLVEDFGYTQEQVAERVGKERSTVANSLRLLRLPTGVRGMVEGGALSMGHARALLALEPEDIEPTARRVVSRKLSVRATEDWIRKQSQPPAERAQAQAQAPKKSASVRDLELRLSKSLGSQVSVDEDGNDKKSGTIQIRYMDLDDLDRLLARLLD
ncbi:ParB/RepB/Spo0J family partition protein [Haliangium ochraceum]|uniref:ParB-like partition protein n=1 Tax=Haliangium ochraceum (strain DSM 14365 / JCM 11303 / SMP-2) TaxID=502025 RepID=D0LQ44_HALO1|nr:ParB/RepB/Spo0J family partition protein [Haliangium ochraceum]ACY17081.1 parB-like partition protein [Haliangium ochraceum DSM 14365]